MKDNDFLKPGDTVSHSNKQLMESPEVEKIAEIVIERESLDFGPASIGFFLVYPNLSKYKAAKCKKASREVEYYSGHNFLIEISGEMWPKTSYGFEMGSGINPLIPNRSYTSDQQLRWKFHNPVCVPI